jgi:hypothetical protein
MARSSRLSPFNADAVIWNLDRTFKRARRTSTRKAPLSTAAVPPTTLPGTAHITEEDARASYWLPALAIGARRPISVANIQQP